MQDTNFSGEEYDETLEYLYNTLPMFQRMGGAALRKDLANTRRFCEAIGNPEKKFKSIHVAGTNGKGSSSHYLAAILQSSGYKTGLYTSPHLKSFTERIRINGVEADKQFIVDFVKKHKPLIESIRPSFFETTVVMAFEYFALHQVDIAVIEVGMGGRLDSTNVILPEISLITNIGFDHQQWLGDTLDKIAFEKAGIIKPYVPVVVSELQPNIQEVFLSAAARSGSSLIFAETDYKIDYSEPNVTIRRPDRPEITFSSPGLPAYQERNIPGVLAVCDELERRGFVIPDRAIAEGLKSMKALTSLKGRWQKLGSNPDVFCDVGHNVDGLSYVLKQISRHSHTNLWMIWGMVNDKEPGPILQMLPAYARYVFCQASVPRAMEAEELKRAADRFGLNGQVIKSVNQALNHVLKKAGETDLIVIGGSNFVVAEIELL